MANQEARLDPNAKSALIAHSAVAANAETRQVVATDGNLHTVSLGGLSPITDFDNISISYPDGTTEIYAYNLGTSPSGTVTVIYTESSKGSISSVYRT